jgi:hypothetical protein
MPNATPTLASLVPESSLNDDDDDDDDEESFDGVVPKSLDIASLAARLFIAVLVEEEEEEEDVLSLVEGAAVVLGVDCC